MQLSIHHLNQLDKVAFIKTLADIFEHSPWVPERAFEKAPFESLTQLHAFMVQVVAEAALTEQLDLIRAHPDLAGKAARTGNLTVSSTSEQRSAGLDSLSDSEYETFHSLNNAYKARFEFPFILAVKGHTKHSILASFETRLLNSAEEERQTALEQIAKIAEFRLKDLLHD